MRLTIFLEYFTLGEAWADVCGKILEEGVEIFDGDVPLLELADVSFVVGSPSSEDRVMKSHLADPGVIWMKSIFKKEGPVTELGDSLSYASRLYAYPPSGVDQVDVVVEKLRSKPETKSATLTTLTPSASEKYVPCVSLLDFKYRSGMLKCTVFCRSLDFGKKALGDFAALLDLLTEVAKGAGIDPEKTSFLFHVASAHVYVGDVTALKEALKACGLSR